MSTILDNKINFWTNDLSIILDVTQFDAVKFGKWLKTTRENTVPLLSITELAKRAVISKQYVSLLEKGDDHNLTNKPVQPALDKVENLAKVLGADINEVRELAGYERFPTTSSSELVSISFDFEGLPEKEIDKVNYLKSLLESEIKKLEVLKNTTVKNTHSSALDALEANPEFEKQKSRAKKDAAEVKK